MSRIQIISAALFLLLIPNSEGNSKLIPKPLYKTIYGRLCGSNFETYVSLPRFMEAKERKPDLYVLHRGRCKTLCQIYAPVCASDWRTYHNECQLEYAKMKNRNLYLQYKGICEMKLLTHSKNQALFDYEYYFHTLERVNFDNCTIHC